MKRGITVNEEGNRKYYEFQYSYTLKKYFTNIFEVKKEKYVECFVLKKDFKNNLISMCFPYFDSKQDENFESYKEMFKGAVIKNEIEEINNLLEDYRNTEKQMKKMGKYIDKKTKDLSELEKLEV